jgi:hypothetical protein
LAAFAAFLAALTDFLVFLSSFFANLIAAVAAFLTSFALATIALAFNISSLDPFLMAILSYF